jgi:Secretion system C-terminal sorting domain
MPNHPNPFTNQTVMPFLLPNTGQVKLTIYDLTGKVVFSQENWFAKGYNEILFQPEANMPVGLYMYRLQTDTQTAERKMMLKR